MPRDYTKEYANYQGKPEQIANRTKRNAARREMEKKGVVRKGDGMDVHHRKPIVQGGENGHRNLEAVPKSKNRSFARTRSAGMK
jgi:hypothetical protein